MTISVCNVVEVNCGNTAVSPLSSLCMHGIIYLRSYHKKSVLVWAVN